MQHQKVQLPLLVNIVIALFGIILFFFVLTIAESILIPLAFSFVFSLFLYPFCKRLENKGLPKWLSILICLLGIILILTVIISLIYSNLLTFTSDFPQMRDRTMQLISNTQTTIEDRFHISPEKQLEWLNQNLNSFVKASGVFVNNLMSSATTFFTYILLIPIYTFFMMYYRGVLKEFINRVIRHDHREKAIIIEEQIILVIQKYISGLFTVILIIGILNFVGLWLIGIQHALFFGALAALLTVIPYVGVFIGSLLPIVYAVVMTDSFYYPLAVFVWFQIVQGLEGNFITPNIIGAQVSLNPLVAIVALLLGAMIWGVPGMILFTPFTAMLKVFLDNIPELAPFGFLLSEGEQKKNLPNKTKKSWIFWKHKNTPSK